MKNRVFLIGNLGMDPEFIETSNGGKLAKARVATSESYYNKNGERVTETQWHNIVAWGKDADFFGKNLKKGNEIFIDGKIVNRTYENANGEMKYMSEVHVKEVYLSRGNNIPKKPETVESSVTNNQSNTVKEPANKTKKAA